MRAELRERRERKERGEREMNLWECRPSGTVAANVPRAWVCAWVLCVSVCDCVHCQALHSLSLSLYALSLSLAIDLRALRANRSTRTAAQKHIVLELDENSLSLSLSLSGAASVMLVCVFVALSLSVSLYSKVKWAPPLIAVYENKNKIKFLFAILWIEIIENFN